MTTPQPTPVCPCCKSNVRVTVSPRLELGSWFCPCNEPGSQYFDTSLQQIAEQSPDKYVFAERAAAWAARQPFDDEGRMAKERDDAEEAIGQAYYLITGRSPEWSNLFGYEAALEEIAATQRALREEITTLSKWQKIAQDEGEKLVIANGFRDGLERSLSRARIENDELAGSVEVLEQERDQLRDDLADTSEAWQQLGAAFPRIELECDTQVAAAQFIIGEFEKASQWDKMIELEITNLRSLKNDLEEDLATLSASESALRTALEAVYYHWQTPHPEDSPTAFQAWRKGKAALAAPSAEMVVCPRCAGSNNVSDLGAKWAYEPGPCPFCDGQKVERCKKCYRLHRFDKPCECERTPSVEETFHKMDCQLFEAREREFSGNSQPGAAPVSLGGSGAADAVKELADAKREAEALATSIWKTEFKDIAPDWSLCDSVAGVISQIDNMFAGVRQQRDEAKYWKALQAVEIGSLGGTNYNLQAQLMMAQNERDGLRAELADAKLVMQTGTGALTYAQERNENLIAQLATLSASESALRTALEEAQKALLDVRADVGSEVGGGKVTGRTQTQGQKALDVIEAALAPPAGGDDTARKITVQTFLDEVEAMQPETAFWESLDSATSPFSMEAAPHRGEGGATTLLYQGGKLVGATILQRDGLNRSILICVDLRDAARGGSEA